MKLYKIFSHPQGSYEAVKQGWSWPGFFFGPIWAMTKKMWQIGIGFLIGGLLLGAILGGTNGGESLARAIGIGLNILFATTGNKWREENLLKRGFELKDTVKADNAEGAVALYIKEHQPVPKLT